MLDVNNRALLNFNGNTVYDGMDAEIILYKVAIYLRLSRDDENIGDSGSIINQREFLTKHVENQANWELVNIYIDDGYTGTNFNRPSWLRLKRDIELGKVNLVITKDLSRLGRDYIETGYYLEKFFPTHRVRYIAVNDGIDTFSKNSNNDMSPFMSVVNDMYAKDISKKIKLANEVKDIYGIDTLIVGRGGGSLEDLWPFNEEIVARAIYDSKLPVISAVGHEVDITISDYVADLRAPTPTAAAELAVPDINTIITYLDNARSRGYTALTNIVNINYKKLDAIKNSYILSKPMSMYEIKEQKLDILIDSLNKAMNKKLENTKVKLYTLENSYILNNPNMLYKYSTQKLEHIISKLEVLNPLNTLSRGYAIIKKDGKVLPSVKNMKKDDVVTITLNDGEVTSKIIKVGEKNG